MRKLILNILRGCKQCAVILVVTSCVYSSLPQERASSKKSEPQISVRLSTSRMRFNPVQDVPLHVEIWNIGEQDIFVYKKIEAAVSNDLAKIDLTLYHGAESSAPGFTLSADFCCSEPANYPPLANELAKYWVAIPPDISMAGIFS